MLCKPAQGTQRLCEDDRSTVLNVPSRSAHYLSSAVLGRPRKAVPAVHSIRFAATAFAESGESSVRAGHCDPGLPSSRMRKRTPTRMHTYFSGAACRRPWHVPPQRDVARLDGRGTR